MSPSDTMVVYVNLKISESQYPAQSISDPSCIFSIMSDVRLLAERTWPEERSTCTSQNTSLNNTLATPSSGRTSIRSIAASNCNSLVAYFSADSITWETEIHEAGAWVIPEAVGGKRAVCFFQPKSKPVVPIKT